MKKFIVDLTEVKVNPLPEDMDYKKGDVFTKIIDTPFDDFEVEKIVTKITINEFHRCKFIFVENAKKSFNGVHETFEDMVNEEINRLMENPNA